MTDVVDRLLSWLHSLAGSASGILSTIEGIDPLLRTVIAGASALLETFVVTGLFVPGDTVVLLAASAVARPSDGVMLGTSIAIGALLGEMAGYGLGHWISASPRGQRLRRRTGGARIASARRFLLRRGGPAILAARFIPVLRTVMPFAVGLSGYPFRQFLIWSIPTSAAWSAIYVTAYSLAAAPLREGTPTTLAAIGLPLLGLLLFGAAYALQFVVERRHSPDDRLPSDTDARDREVA